MYGASQVSFLSKTVALGLHFCRAVVDAFVILESRMTFRATHRSLHYPRLINRLPARVIAKVKYVVLDSLEGADAWAKEKHQRNALFEVGLPEAHPQPGDIIIVADLDEIPKPAFVAALKQCSGAQYPLSMQASLRYYSFDFVAAGQLAQVCRSEWQLIVAASQTCDYCYTCHSYL
jgi:beta-1,4-mannosyl-glycoprotein beta-1,4-N-acetylglucosaminyltransferase